MNNIVPLEQINTFENFIAAPAVKSRIAAVLPQHLNPERMMRTVALAAYKNPKLREVHMMSLLGAVMTCASMGFEPNTPLGHAYLIPFEKKKYNRSTREYETERVDVNVVFGYPGLIDLARRTGNLVSITAKIVHAGDEWSFEYGSNMHLRHRPVGRTEGRKPIYAYAYAKLTDGEAFEALPYEEALDFRRYSQSWQTARHQIEEAEADEKNAWKAKSRETPWIKHEAQMVQKTMVRRLANWLPKNIEFATALKVDGLADAGKIDFSALAALPPAEVKGMIEAGAVPEQESDLDDAPATRPEREEVGRKPGRQKKTAQSVADTPAARAAREKAEAAGTTTETEETSSREADSSTEEAKPSTEPQRSEALDDALAALTKIWDRDEIAGAREALRKELSQEEYQAWQRAALAREQLIAKQEKR